MNSVRLLLRSLIARYHAADDDDTEPGHPTALFESPSSAPPPLQTVLSSDDELAMRARSPTAEHGDLHALMADEDARRARLFQREGRGAKAGTKRSRSPPGAHVGFQLAQRHTQRVVCCAACGGWLCRPQEVLPEAEQVADCSLDDSEYTLCVRQADVVERDEHSLTKAGTYTYALANVRCRRCDVFVGVKVTSLEVHAQTEAAQRHHAQVRTMHDLLSDIFNDSRGVRISAPDARWLDSMSPPRLPPPFLVPAPDAVGSSSIGSSSSSSSAGADDDDDEGTVHCVGRLTRRSPPPPPPAAPEVAAPACEVRDGSYAVGQIYLGIRYLRIADAQTMAPIQPVVPLLCVGCGSTLSYTDQIMCTKRRWGFGDGAPENACFMNSLVKGAFVVGDSYEEHLAQGLMEMADVHCKCGKQVGYKFCGDKTTTKRNLNQVGRYGLVSSCFSRAPYQLTRPHAAAA